MAVILIGPNLGPFDPHAFWIYQPHWELLPAWFVVLEWSAVLVLILLGLRINLHRRTA